MLFLPILTLVIAWSSCCLAAFCPRNQRTDHHTAIRDSEPSNRPPFSTMVLSFSHEGGDVSAGVDDTEVTGAFLEYMFRERGCQGETEDIAVLTDEQTGRRGLMSLPIKA